MSFIMNTRQQNKCLLNYINHYMDPYNIGDVLCNPLLYFNIECKSPIYIVGGGVWQNWYHEPNTIYWSPGKSFKNTVYDTSKPEKYILLSSRDIDSETRHVPCVSVMNDIVDIAPGESHSFIIGNSDTVGFVVPNTMFSVELEPQKYEEKFKATNRISTNSYHAAYWGLLSGRKVKLYGYSSKFSSLLKGFGFNGDEYVKYEKGSMDSFRNAIASKTEWLQIDSNQYKKAFREMNLDFASDVGKLKEIKKCCII